MKIALITYEYPPDTALGGIATYAKQAAHMLQHREHQVEVFTASFDRSGMAEESGVIVHRIQLPNRSEFAREIAPVFARRHQVVGFDVLEGPDYGADAAIAAQQVPDIPLVVKLHTPTYLAGWANYILPSWPVRARITLGALRRGKLPEQPAIYQPDHDPECLHARTADAVIAPSLAIGQRVSADWNFPSGWVSHIPYPYTPAPSLLDIPIETQTHTITFLGRLEVRKGILDLAQAIPLILRRYPQAKFRLIGASLSSPQPGLDMQAYLRAKLHRYESALEFTGHVPLAEISTYLQQTDICVFPSIWESFGLVCLEAMAAGRGVVGSAAGGMAELLNQGEFGKLVPPQQPRQLATALLSLLENPTLRMHYGETGRQRVLEHYEFDRIGRLQEENYQIAIQRRQVQGPRHLQGQHPLPTSSHPAMARL
jgi:glycogen synthase